MFNYKATTEFADKEIEKYYEELVLLNDEIAKNPEISGQEFETSKKIINLIKSKGYKVEFPLANVVNSFRGVYGENNHKYKVAIMVEFDALPELGHACGHCLSGAISILAGFGLKELQDELNADFHILGTPNEEATGMKARMAREGVFDKYDTAIMIHMNNYNAVETKLLAITAEKYIFHGKAAHASAEPWNGRNSFNGAQLMFHAVDMLRQHVKPDVRIHGLITHAGEMPNIVPEKSVVEIYSRASERKYLNEVLEMVEDCARGAAIATRTTYEKKLIPEAFDNLHSVKFGLDLLRETYDELDIPRNEEKELFGSSDAGNVSMVCPTFHSALEVAGPNVCVHTREMAEAMTTEDAHNTLRKGAMVISHHLIKLFGDEENIKRLKKDYEESFE